MPHRNHPILLALLSACTTLTAAIIPDIIDLGPYSVIAQRSLENSSSQSISSSKLTQSDIELFSGSTIDTLLSQSVEFQNFRLSDSISSHPTAHGVRLRGIATSGSSRTLVLRDGIPLNDPFGGWVHWSRLRSRDLQSISFHPGGGNGTWGNLDAGGLIYLQSHTPSQSPNYLTLRAGAPQRYGAELGTRIAAGKNTHLHFSAHLLDADGDYGFAAADRGPIDRRTALRSEGFGLRSESNIDGFGHLMSFVDWHREKKNNGLPSANNSSESLDIALRYFSPDYLWEAVVYFQDREFDNVFASVIGADRTQDRPVLDQYDVPATAWGGSLSRHGSFSDSISWLAGTDFRYVDGTVRENYSNLGSGFTRNREAGGRQWFAGAFIKVAWTPDDLHSWDLTLRGDALRQYDGFRREYLLSNNSQTRNDTYATNDEEWLSARIRYTRTLNAANRIEWTAFSGFRAPTLNELYRPYRVGNDVTEANPNLSSEQIRGTEIAWISQITTAWNLQLAVYYNDLTDMAANVRLPESSWPGSIPAGGSYSERLNVAKSSAHGIKLDNSFNLTENLQLELSYLWNATRFSGSAGGTALSGDDFPLSPEHRINLRIQYQPTDKLNLWLGMQAWSRSYDGIGTDRPLPGNCLFYAGLNWNIDNNWSFNLQLFNLTDTTIETGRDASGTYATGAERRLETSITYLW